MNSMTLINYFVFSILTYLIYKFLTIMNSINTYEGNDLQDIYLLIDRVSDLEDEVKNLKKKIS
jgi:hypothetical protein